MTCDEVVHVKANDSCELWVTCLGLKVLRETYGPTRSADFCFGYLQTGSAFLAEVNPILLSKLICGDSAEDNCPALTIALMERMEQAVEVVESAGMASMEAVEQDWKEPLEAVQEHS